MPQYLSKIATLDGPRQLSFKEETIDSSHLGENEILCKTLYSCISPGTEMAAYSGKPPIKPHKVYPRLQGYCNVARVEHVGAKVQNFQVGDLINSMQSHRSYFKCHENEPFFKLQKNDDTIRMSAAYLYHIGYHNLMECDFRPGMNVAVIGLGCLGLMVVQMVQAFGGKIFGLSSKKDLSPFVSDQKLLWNYQKNDTDVFAKVEKDSNGDGLDIIVTTSDTWEDWELAIKLARRKTVITVMSFIGRGLELPKFNPLEAQYSYYRHLTIKMPGDVSELEFPPWDLHLSIKRKMRYLADLIRSQRLHPEKLITEIVPANQLGSIYKKFDTQRSREVTVVLDWNEKN